MVVAQLLATVVQQLLQLGLLDHQVLILGELVVLQEFLLPAADLALDHLLVAQVAE
jgi:hypothetical protein